MCSCDALGFSRLSVVRAHRFMKHNSLFSLGSLQCGKRQQVSSWNTSPSKPGTWAALEYVCTDLASMWGSSTAVKRSTESWSVVERGDGVTLLHSSPYWTQRRLFGLPRKPVGGLQDRRDLFCGCTLPPETTVQILPYFIIGQCLWPAHPGSSSLRFLVGM